MRNSPSGAARIGAVWFAAAVLSSGLAAAGTSPAPAAVAARPASAPAAPVAAATAAPLAATPVAASAIHHALKVSLDPAAGTLTAEDRMTIPGDAKEVRLLLHAGLSPRLLTPEARLRIEKTGVRAVELGVDSDDLPLSGSVPLDVLRLTLPKGSREVVLSWSGVIRHTLEAQEENYARGFSETAGTITPDGVYLSRGTGWFPAPLPGTRKIGGGRTASGQAADLSDSLATFVLEVRVPTGWDAVSQGKRTVHEKTAEATRVVWDSAEPQDDIYLIAAKFTETARVIPGGAAGKSPGGPPERDVTALAFLRDPDEPLANKYLDATGQYLEMYGRLLGPYPYEKFALVENFWETGYGMPSFTLLGSKVIRLPFILTSSYPHEILHNWWGNGVYVDSAAGNWCEGLTAYLADHLFAEQKGAGADYRRETLQKYADYVSTGKDFPLTGFRERSSAATEAVGYGKSLMFFHDLRRRMGDERFVKGLRLFYERNLFRRASFDDLRRAFQDSGREEDLTPLFAEATERTGAPVLRLAEASARRGEKEWTLSLDLRQEQSGQPFHLEVPIAITLLGREQAWDIRIPLDARQVRSTIHLPARPLRVDVDPAFDLFRRLDRAEVPVALSRAFGAEQAVVVLPAKAPEPLLAAYRALAAEWEKGSAGHIEVTLDAEISSLPADRTVWLFGWENQFLPQASWALHPYGASASSEAASFDEKTNLPRAGHSAAFATAHPANPAQALAWLASDTPAALPGLGRKLPHYHKYSWLGFEGDEPTNRAKGQWPVVSSPLVVFPRAMDADGTAESAASDPEAVERAALPAREALAGLVPVASTDRLMGTVRYLAGDDMKGRGFGSPELDLAGLFIAEKLREAGLQPAGKDGEWYDSWLESGGDPPRQVTMRNVLGVLPGRKAEWAGQSVVVAAHYDHLGFGWPDVREEFRGKLHPGADDNASGVAALIELARLMAKSGPYDRTIVFAAFSGEEAGRLGSLHYAAAEKTRLLPGCIGMVNLDTVGRLGTGKLLVLGTGSASEWIHIFNGAGYVTGVPVEVVAGDIGGSDQKSFLDRGVPAVQLTTGPHDTYHRPTDTADTVDADGLAKIVAVAKEAVEYLAGRGEPLSSTLAPARSGAPDAAAAGAGGATGGVGSAGASPAPPSGRRVSFGAVPDFGFPGPGVRLTGTVPGSPAEKAGMNAGDTIVRVGSSPIGNLKDFSEILKTLQPGNRVSVTFVRDGAEHTIETEVIAR